MTLNNFYNEVAKRADTGKTAINVAETKRVLSEAFLVLNAMSAVDAANVVAKGLSTASSKAAKKPAAAKPAAKKTTKKKAAKKRVSKKK